MSCRASVDGGARRYLARDRAGEF